MRRLLSYLLALLAPLAFAPASAQSFTTVSATTIQDGFGAPMASGVACFYPTASNGTFTIITPSGGSAVPGPFCTIITNGAFSLSTTPNLATAAPSGLLYTMIATKSNGVVTLTLNGLAVTGSSYNLDALVVPTPPYPAQPSAFGLGIPYYPCLFGALYTRTDASTPATSGWTCQVGGSGTFWQQTGPGVPPPLAPQYVTAPQVTLMIRTQGGGVSGVSSITPGTNVTCTPIVLGVCTGAVTVNATGGGGGGGTVTSAGLAAPSALLSVSGSPITTSGLFTLSLANAAQNSIWAGPPTGGAGAPSYQTSPTIAGLGFTSLSGCLYADNTTHVVGGITSTLGGCVTQVTGITNGVIPIWQNAGTGNTQGASNFLLGHITGYEEIVTTTGNPILTTNCLYVGQTGLACGVAGTGYVSVGGNCSLCGAEVSVRDYFAETTYNLGYSAFWAANNVANEHSVWLGVNPSTIPSGVGATKPDTAYLLTEADNIGLNISALTLEFRAGNNASALSALTIGASNTIFLPTLGASTSGLLKSAASTGLISNATAGTDYQAPITLTTTGSGAATFISNVLNIPTPSGSGVSITSSAATLTVTPSPLTGTGTIDINLAHTNSWSASQSNSALWIGTIPGSSAQGAFAVGTLPYSDIGIGHSVAGNSNSYIQSIVSNANAGAAASADYIVSNDQGTATTHYGDFGINSSGFTGTGNLLNLPGETYLYAQNGDLGIGTNTANAIHIVANNASTDAITVSSANAVTINGTPTLTLTNGTGLPLTTGVTGLLPHANIAATAVTPGSYTSANITVAADGSITAAANGSGGSPAFSSITTGTNTVALLMGTGGSLGVSGTGTINATTLLASTWASPAAIGTGTPAAITGTSLTATSLIATSRINGTGSTSSLQLTSGSGVLPTTGNAFVTVQAGGNVDTNNTAATTLTSFKTSNTFSTLSGTLTVTGAWVGAQFAETWGVGGATAITYNSTTPMQQIGCNPTINVTTASTGHYDCLFFKPTETSIGTGVRNFFWEAQTAAGAASSSMDTTGFLQLTAIGQVAASNTAGTCTMAAGTSCTITLTHTYTTPVCIATQQSATLTGGAVGCTVSGTTVTVTSAVLNSEVWGALVFGNPN